MDELKKKAIERIVDTSIYAFAEGLMTRYKEEVNDPQGVINAKKNNCFMAELGEEFMFYSAFVRSFDSSFGNVLEKMGNELAELSYTVHHNIESFMIPDQTQRIASIVNSYLSHAKPSVGHYANFDCIKPTNIESYKRKHVTDHYFYDPETNSHFLIELKASGDLDNKKARSEKEALLEEYFLLKNLVDDKATVKIYFGTAYNKFGEGNEWKQERVKQFFSDDELLIGADYWNFVCNDKDGFKIVFEQYKKSANYIRTTLEGIKELYF